MVGPVIAHLLVVLDDFGLAGDQVYLFGLLAHCEQLLCYAGDYLFGCGGFFPGIGNNQHSDEQYQSTSSHVYVH